MTACQAETEQATPSISLDSFQAKPVPVSPGHETSMPPQSTTSFYSLISFSGMAKTAVPVSDFVWRSFATQRNVRAVLAGESGDVLHVWILINEWTPQARKQVYAIQKTIMRQLEGFHFDFYVVDLPEDTTPEEMVSDIPLVFKRA